MTALPSKQNGKIMTGIADLRESVARVEERARGLELSADLRAILSALSNARAAIAAALKEMEAA